MSFGVANGPESQIRNLYVVLRESEPPQRFGLGAAFVVTRQLPWALGAPERVREKTTFCGLSAFTQLVLSLISLSLWSCADYCISLVTLVSWVSTTLGV